MATTRRGDDLSEKKPSLTVTRSELLSGDGDLEFRAMLYDFFAFGGALEQARSHFANFAEMSAAQYLSLIVIARSPAGEPVGVNHVADRLRLSGAFATIEINKLVREGLVEKKPHPSDRRRVQLFATQLGKQKLERLAAIQRPVNDALFETLTRDEFTQLKTIMSRLAQGAPRALQLAKYLSEHEPR